MKQVRCVCDFAINSITKIPLNVENQASLPKPV